MQNEENISIPRGKKRRRKKRNWGYLYLFAFVFLGALFGLSYLVKSFSPNVDVTIGNNASLTLSDSDMEVAVKSVDERLKWIQMEDEMPTVAIRGQENNTQKEKIKNEEEIEELTEKNNKKELENKSIKNPPLPSISDIKPQVSDFRTAIAEKPVIPQPKPTITKVYLGAYSSIEEAMSVQNKISKDETSITPFIKAIGNTYIVQLGSFSDKERAITLVGELKSKGYSPKITFEN